jgi:hypothetical protein
MGFDFKKYTIIMWVKEVIRRKERIVRESQKKRLLWSILIAVIFTLGFTFTYGGIGAAQRGTYFKPTYEIVQSLPTALITGIIFGLIFYFILLKNSEIITLVCPQCEKIKENDGMLTCECGGHFEDIKTMKWVEDKKGTV